MKPQDNPQKQESSLVEAEIQHDIPVKQHISDIKNPITNIKQFVDHNKKDDKELDQVLQDVNKSVKEPEKKQKKKFKISFGAKKVKPGAKKQPDTKEAGAEKKRKSPASMLAVVTAILVATLLSVAAFYAFNQPKEVATNNEDKSTNSSTTQVADPVLTAKDIDELSTDLQTKIDGFDDAQEFNSTDLSDSSIGL